MVRDLTATPVKHFLIQAATMMGMGIAAFLVMMLPPLLAFPINLAAGAVCGMFYQIFMGRNRVKDRNAEALTGLLEEAEGGRHTVGPPGVCGGRAWEGQKSDPHCNMHRQPGRPAHAHDQDRIPF